MSMSPLKTTKKLNPSINLDNFTEGGPNVEDAKEIGSPRSLLVARRLGYEIHEVGALVDFVLPRWVFAMFLGKLCDMLFFPPS